MKSSPESEAESYLREHIPLSAAMGVVVVALGPERATLSAPLAPNVNHRQTVFGGSLSALATLACWTWLWARLAPEEDGAERPRLVIRSGATEYVAAATADFTAECAAPAPNDWDRFADALRRRGRARLRLSATVTSAGVVAATFAGEFVALPPE